MNQTDISSYCSFHCGANLYGIDIRSIKEISTESSITPIHHSQKEVEGYVNIRGEIYLVINLKKMLNLDSENHEAINKRLLIFKNDVGENFCIQVDDIGDIVRVEKNKIEDRRISNHVQNDALNDRGPDVSVGVCKLNEELLIVLSPETILSSICCEEK